MGKVKNILFIMCDQLRADYLSAEGHPTLETPNIDALAARGVRFPRAYCQSPICGPSRASFYTGRYMFSHGANWNNVPVPVGELTMGDYLRPLGQRVALVGKTHMRADLEGMTRLQVAPDSGFGQLIAECGFEPYERDDGLHPDQSVDPDLAYNQYLRDKGYDGGHNPWHTVANSAAGPDGEILSGWQMRYARLPARVREEDSETPYTTSRGIDFIEAAGREPWCLHLSYIKPHWPYIAPAPYNDMYGPNQVLPANRHPREQENPHPVHAAFMQHEDSLNFQDEDIRLHVTPVYMGLVKQIDDQIGRLMAYLEETGHLDDTMIVFTSDHGDYLGDHWLGEKDLFHEESVRIPMIVYDPDPAADQTRGEVDQRFVEAIDLLPTFVDVLGGEAQPHRLEGRSLLPLLRDGSEDCAWRDAAFSESDYAWRPARQFLGLGPEQARAFMVRTDDWKYIHFEHFRPQLFDLKADPRELMDLGESADHAEIRAELHEQIFAWLRRRRTRTTISDAEIDRRAGASRSLGILIGVW